MSVERNLIFSHFGSFSLLYIQAMFFLTVLFQKILYRRLFLTSLEIIALFHSEFLDGILLGLPLYIGIRPNTPEVHMIQCHSGGLPHSMKGYTVARSGCTPMTRIMNNRNATGEI